MDNPRRSFYPTISTESLFRKEILAAAAADTTLVVEVFSTWCGPSELGQGMLKQLVSESTHRCDIRCCSLDVDQVSKSLQAKRLDDEWDVCDEDMSPSKWSRFILPWLGTIEPTFLIFRHGRLCSIVEGLNPPLLGFNLEWISQPQLDSETVRVGITQKEINAAAFIIQTWWRRRQQLARIGVIVNGIFKTHSELEHEQQLVADEWRQKARTSLQFRSAVAVQRIFRGFLVRRWVSLHKKQPILRHRPRDTQRRTPTRSSRQSKGLRYL
ncbi:hypothetical protein DIPPA_61752 [Diplonema papillatum]|nr:hypothetical protein DIPPA_61752 [Diplonema papillatum]KAJ9438989.1 hypothetical protein DIPPA_61752 [Diplonema papillatum]